ncbi:hypothetical protein ACY3NT_004411 [Enterobacter sichuanensis]
MTNERGAVRWSGQYGSFGEIRHARYAIRAKGSHG